MQEPKEGRWKIKIEGRAGHYTARGKSQYDATIKLLNRLDLNYSNTKIVSAECVLEPVGFAPVEPVRAGPPTGPPVRPKGLPWFRIFGIPIGPLT